MCPQQTADGYLSEIREKDFRIISRESREEAHKVFELDATDLVTNEHFTFNDTFIFYSQFSSICGKPFIEKGDTLIKMRGKLTFRVLKKNCVCEMVIGKSERDNVFVDWKKSHGYN